MLRRDTASEDRTRGHAHESKHSRRSGSLSSNSPSMIEWCIGTSPLSLTYIQLFRERPDALISRLRLEDVNHLPRRYEKHQPPPLVVEPVDEWKMDKLIE